MARPADGISQEKAYRIVNTARKRGLEFGMSDPRVDMADDDTFVVYEKADPAASFKISVKECDPDA